MKSELLEKRVHGTKLFQFQIYHLSSGNLKIFAPLHWHREIEIIHVLSGTTQLTLDDKRYTLGPGDVALINSGQLHALDHCQGTYRHDAFLFPLDFITFESYDYCQSQFILPLENGEAVLRNFVHPDHPQSAQIKNMLSRMAQLCREKQPGYQLAVKGEVLSLLSCLISGGLWFRPSQDEAGLPSVERNKAILDFIHQHSAERLTLEQVSSHFNYSQKYFCSLFKSQFGRTFVEHLNQTRLQQAASLLVSTNRKVMDIALCVGFDNFSYFIRRFREYSGYTPAQFRKECQQSLSHNHQVHWHRKAAGPSESIEIYGLPYEQVQET